MVSIKKIPARQTNVSKARANYKAAMSNYSNKLDKAIYAAQGMKPLETARAIWGAGGTRDAKKQMNLAKTKYVNATNSPLRRGRK